MDDQETFVGNVVTGNGHEGNVVYAFGSVRIGVLGTQMFSLTLQGILLTHFLVLPKNNVVNCCIF